jgi:hypothetical protein
VCYTIIKRAIPREVEEMLTKNVLSYIAGFLDGDGCIMLQLIFRHDYVLGYQIRASIVFYQDTRYRNFLEWLKEELSYGYVRDRNDGISEYTIVGLEPARKVIQKLSPYLKLKSPQARLAIKVIDEILKEKKLTPAKLVFLARKVDYFAKLNYSKKRTNTSQVVEKFLKSKNISFDPVSTDSRFDRDEIAQKM